MIKLGTSRNTWIKRTAGVFAAGSIVLAMAPAAQATSHTATQVVTGSIGSSVSISTAPTGTVSLGAMPAVGTTTVSAGSIGVTANVLATLTVQAEKATMTKYVSGAYDTTDPPVALATAMSAAAVLTSGTAVPVASLSIGTTATNLATGINGTAVLGVTLAQVTVVGDKPTTYRNTLTYTASAAL